MGTHESDGSFNEIADLARAVETQKTIVAEASEAMKAGAAEIERLTKINADLLACCKRGIRLRTSYDFPPIETRMTWIAMAMGISQQVL